MNPKKVSESRTVITEIIFPQDTNHYGTAFGGKVLEYVDKAAAITCSRHARLPVVTASIDSVDFLNPVRVGDVLIVEAIISSTGRTSMEVYITVTAENLRTGVRLLTGTCFATFVALDDEGRPAPVPPIEPETAEERHLHATAQDRYAMRKQRKAAAATLRELQ